MNLGNSLSTRFEYGGRAEDLDESISLHRSSLALRSEDDPERPSSLSNLGDSLATRFRHTRKIEDLDEAISVYRVALALCPDGNVTRPTILANLGTHLKGRFEHGGNIQDLEESITLLRTALAIRHDNNPNRSSSLGSLGNSLLARFDQSRRIEDLEEAIALYRTALIHCPDRDATRSSILMNLGVSLSTHYEYSGEFDKLDESIAVLTASLAIQPSSHPDRSLTLSNLGNVLQSRYLHMGKLEDLDESISLHRAALSLRPDGHPMRYVSQNNLGNSLRSRFAQAMRIEDLEESITLHRASLASCPGSHPDRFAMLNNLGDSLNRHFAHTGRIEDLDESISLYRASVTLCPEGHAFRSSLQDNLGDALRIRVEHGGTVESLDESISLHNVTLASYPGGHPRRVLALSYLGNSLRTRFSHRGRIEDIDDAVASYRAAVALLNVDHPNYSASLVNLGSSLKIRFEHCGRPEDISESINLHCAALNLRPDGHPDRTSALHGLADAIYSRFRREGSAVDLEDTIEFSRCAAAHTFSSTFRRLKAAQQWSVRARTHDHQTTSDAYGAVMSLLQRALTIRPTLSSQHDLLSSSIHYQTIALDAASYAIEKEGFTHAIEVLEQGRALLWSEMQGVRAPLDQLSRVDKTLGDRFQHCSRRLDALMTSSDLRSIPIIVDRPHGNAHSTIREQHSEDDLLVQMRKLSDEQAATINEIRKIPEFENFLQTLPFETLKQAALEGPIVVINHCKFRSDALIVLTHADTPCVCVPLDGDWYTKGNELCTTLLQSRREFGVGSVKYDETLRRAMRVLWDRVVSKVVQKFQELGIPKGSRIWWCPTSVLSMLPLHAAGPYEDADGSMRYLLDDYVSSYTPTLKSLINARQGVQSGGERLLFVGDTKLHSTNKERNSIRRFRRINKQLLDDRASPASVVRALHKAEWVHFVCHGILDEEPFNSSLKLPDGRLTLLDIVRANIPNAEFAYLSACHTAEQGSKFALDETLHLAAAMQFCGFRSVVGTMWQLLDRDGPVLAEVVYHRLMEDLEEGEIRFKRAARAVREAALWLRERKDVGPDGNEVGVMTERWVNLVHIGA